MYLDKNLAYDAIFEYAEVRDYDIAYPVPEYISNGLSTSLMMQSLNTPR